MNVFATLKTVFFGSKFLSEHRVVISYPLSTG